MNTIEMVVVGERFPQNQREVVKVKEGGGRGRIEKKRGSGGRHTAMAAGAPSTFSIPSASHLSSKPKRILIRFAGCIEKTFMLGCAK